MPIDKFIHCVSGRGALQSDEALFYLAEIALGLNYIHSKRIAHLNLKPANILITHSGHIAITDTFGFNHLTASNILYAAPERLSKNHNLLGPPADWWAFGIISYQLLSGKLPFTHKEPRLLFTNILKAQPNFDEPQFIAAFNRTTHISDSSHHADQRSIASLDKEKKNEAVQAISAFLIKDPSHRLGTENGINDLKQSPWFCHVAWDDTLRKLQTPPHIPHFLLYDSPAEDDDTHSCLSSPRSPSSIDRPSSGDYPSPPSADIPPSNLIIATTDFSIENTSV
eukprot:CAMPEP_0197319856 /NCGR_PEP_ID=MMETSP0891-20130614/56626_1 /TAXON_ID=44058 ORGANISM="Aureoumbra lagunensis, Strain CCMP1510" /NCGR_SAMPLE_ID=MMETSP0891 /ASSEMBLY_ACC=CAM_ASM_000534 /LENGTH=281 /DNA_ID=CAMNT_0042811001 /DNA_START=521 /DNA_END=1366 /DNA_ORIENTATION=+